MAGKAYGRFKIYGHDILLKKKILHIGASCVCVCLYVWGVPEQPAALTGDQQGGKPSLPSPFAAVPSDPCNKMTNKCNQSNWLPESFFNALHWTQDIHRASKYKVSVPVGSDGCK